MPTAVLDTSIRSLRDPRDANIRFAAASAVEVEDGETPQALELQQLGARARRAAAGCGLHVWYGVPVQSQGWALDGLLPCLPAHEQSEVLAHRLSADRWAVAAARAAVRVHLSQLLDCRPAQVAIIRGALGKPHLDPAVYGSLAERLHFNISHTRNLVAVAVATRRVGIDVEAVQPPPDLAEIAASTFSPEMVRIIETARTPAERDAHFYRFWTLGESLIKATGDGLAFGLQSFAFSESDPPYLTRIDGNWGPTKRWAFSSIDATGDAVNSSKP